MSGPNSSVLHLKESHAGERGRYTALSYCWGGPQEFRTTKKDLAARIEGFQLDNLPHALQDAVIVTRELGISYLWVDSMCIVQDDVEDKFREISGMRHIYKEAVLTISASNSKAANDGFLHDLSNRRTGLWQSMIPLTYCLPNDRATTMQEAFEMPKGEESRLWLLDEDSYLEAMFSRPYFQPGLVSTGARSVSAIPGLRPMAQVEMQSRHQERWRVLRRGHVVWRSRAEDHGLSVVDARRSFSEPDGDEQALQKLVCTAEPLYQAGDEREGDRKSVV